MKRYHVSENKFDKSTATLNKRVTTSGTTDYTGAFASDYIPISENVNCTITGLITTVVTVIYFYDSSNTNIGYISADSSSSYSFITPNGTAKLRFTGDMNYINTASVITYTWQIKSPPKYGTASETIQSGDTIYANGQPITTYNIKGNEEHTGTPSPSNPVMPNGVGNKTANLFNVNGETDAIAASVTIINNAIKFENVPSGNTARITYSAQYAAGTYYISCVASGSNYTVRLFSDSTFTGATYNSFYGGYYRDFTTSGFSTSLTFDNDFKIGFIANAAGGATFTISNIMLSTTEADYEPFGYKIPISSGQTALNPMYLTGQLMKIGNTVDSLVSTGTATYNIKKLVFNGTENWKKSNNGYFYVENAPADYSNQTLGIVNSMWTHFVAVANSGNGSNLNNGEACFYGTQTPTVPYKETYIKYNAASTADDFKAFLAQEYANGTPVTVWYILATPTTESITAPSIPTTEGANTITVDTTVQPSEFSATWIGWHNAEVKEKSENVYNKYNVIQVANLGTRYGSYVDNGVYSIYNDTDNDVYWGGNGFQSRYLACSPHSTATVDMTSYSYSDYGFIMAYNDASLGDITIVEGSTAPDHYIPYWE